jgi:hypothetical protein
MAIVMNFTDLQITNFLKNLHNTGSHNCKTIQQWLSTLSEQKQPIEIICHHPWIWCARIGSNQWWVMLGGDESSIKNSFHPLYKIFDGNFENIPQLELVVNSLLKIRQAKTEQQLVGFLKNENKYVKQVVQRKISYLRTRAQL